MLYGVTRKVAIPILLLSLFGWILYGVGFGIRNFRYKEVADSTAASPDFFLFWLLLCVGPVTLAFSFLHALWENKITFFLALVFLPFFMIGAGAVLFLNGSTIYSYYRHQSGTVNLACMDNLARANLPYDIHEEFNYVPVEFAGVITSALFYIAFLVVLVSACFWVAYITGFTIRYKQLNVSDGTIANLTYISYWCFSVTGLLLYFLTFIHLLYGNTGTAFAVFLLVPFFLVSVGGVLHTDGLYLYDYYTNSQPNIEYKDYVWTEFLGALFALLFYWVSMVMWVCYSYFQLKHQARSHVEGYETLN